MKTSVTISRIPSLKITDSALESVKYYILKNNLQAGDMLPPEIELCSLLGVSRASLREALRALEALGVLNTVHGVGRFIRDFNYDAFIENLSYNLKIHISDFKEIVDVRMALEEAFLGRAIDLLQEADLEALIALIATMEEQIKQGVSEELLVETHTAFHLKLYERLNNKLLTNLISLFATFQRILSVSRRYKTGDYQEFIASHRTLVRLLISKDKTQIGAVIKHHFTDVNRYIEEHSEATI